MEVETQNITRKRGRNHSPDNSNVDDRDVDLDNGKSNGKDANSNNNENSEDFFAQERMDAERAIAAAPTPDKPAMGRTGGVYIPPHKLREMQKSMTDKSSITYQRMAWDALRKSINGLINKVTTANMTNIVPELFRENLVRGRGLLCRSIMKAQMASPNFTHVYAALVAVINTKMPEVGELLLKRVIMQFRRAYRRNDKLVCIACTKFLAHLVNQQVAHELVALQLVFLLLETPTDDSVEVAVDFIKECGKILSELSPQGIHGIFERFRGILHEGTIDKRVQYMIEGLFAVRKNNWADYPTMLPELDLVESDDQITHEFSLDENHDIQTALNIFHYDDDYEENEKQYGEIRKEILGEEEGEEEAAGDGEAGAEGEVQEEQTEEEKKALEMQDMSEQDKITLRRQIYLTIMSSLDVDECVHKLMKIKVLPGQEKEVCNMILECCSQERTYLRYYGLIGERFCFLQRVYQEQFDECFAVYYATIHRYETNRIRNIAKFFSHLLTTDALDWSVFEYVRLTETDTTSSSRIFIKNLFLELSSLLGLQALKDRLSDPVLLATSFQGLFPKDNPKNTRFAINFFTHIRLGALTADLRHHLKQAPKNIMQQQQAALAAVESDSESSGSSDSDSSGSESDSDSDSGSSSSDSSDSDSEAEAKSKKRNVSEKASSSKSTKDKEVARSDNGKEKAKSKRSRSRSPAKESKRDKPRDDKKADADKDKRRTSSRERRDQPRESDRQRRRSNSREPNNKRRRHDSRSRSR